GLNARIESLSAEITRLVEHEPALPMADLPRCRQGLGLRHGPNVRSGSSAERLMLRISLRCYPGSGRLLGRRAHPEALLSPAEAPLTRLHSAGNMRATAAAFLAGAMGPFD